MIYSINFLELTEKINPLAFAKYLKDTGWTPYLSKKTYIKIFQLLKEDEFYQVTIPMDKNLNDYQDAMYNAIQIVAKVENKSVEQLMLYLLNPSTDILKIRLEKKDIEPGSIHFDDAINLYENAKKLLAATALDILHPEKKYHQGRTDDVVSKFLSSCRYGQTEIGSYVVSIVCPFAELDKQSKFKQLSIFSEEEECQRSLTREVTSRVMSNIAATKKHIDDGDLTDFIENNTKDIVSANFYEALIGLNLDEEDTNVELFAEWSPVVKNTRNVPNRVFLTHDYYQPIQTAIDKLKEDIRQSTKIIGRIKKLESTPDVQARTTGKVTVVYLNEFEKPRTVTVRLQKSDYDKAIEAHEIGAHVEVIGEFSTIGNTSTMTCESFGIID